MAHSLDAQPRYTVCQDDTRTASDAPTEHVPQSLGDFAKRQTLITALVLLDRTLREDMEMRRRREGEGEDDSEQEDVEDDTEDDDDDDDGGGSNDNNSEDEDEDEDEDSDTEDDISSTTTDTTDTDHEPPPQSTEEWTQPFVNWLQDGTRLADLLSQIREIAGATQDTRR